MAARAPRAAIAAALLLLALLAGGAAAGKRVLVLYGASSVPESHSQFFDGLRAAGLELDVKSVKDSGLKLQDYDTWLYDGLILLAPKASSFGGDLTSAGILDFVDSGKHLIIAASSDASEAIRGLALECGVELDDKGTAVYDHFSYQAAGGATDPTLVASSGIVESDAIFGASPPKAPVLFKGIASTVPANSELVTVALSGEGTCYSHDPKKPMPDPPTLPVGTSAALVSLVQARNNARVLVSGSLDMFSNAAFASPVELAATGKKYAVSGNKDFCVSLALWTLGKRGVLRVGGLSHHLVSDPGATPSLYRVNDEVEVGLNVTLLHDGKELPYEADDLQVSFVMLDPYIRQPMVADGSGRFSLRFTVPDVYGVFKYVIDYSRRGYSHIALQQVVPVRPFKHDEYERFLLPAYPYYASVVSTMAAFWLLGLLFLYSR